MKINSRLKAFTLIEIIVVMSMVGLILGLVSINLSKSQQSATNNSAISTLVSDIRSQQINAMLFDTNGEVGTSDYGVYFDTDRYILFTGSVYNASDPNNYVINLPNGSVFESVNTPNSQIIFNKGSGDFSNYATGQDNVIYLDSRGNTRYRVEFNRLGVPNYSKI